MLRPAVTQLISKNDSYYSLVIGIAKRAREIAEELEKDGLTLEEKPVKTAVEEFAVGKFRIIEASELEDGENAKDDASGTDYLGANQKDLLFEDISFQLDTDDEFDDFDTDDINDSVSSDI